MSAKKVVTTGPALPIEAYRAVGPYRFGMREDALEALLGPPDRVVVNAAMEHREVHRGSVMAIFNKRGVLKVVWIKPGARVTFAGHEVFDDNVVAIEAMKVCDDTFDIQKAFLNFPKLGISLGGLHGKRLVGGRVVIVYARSELVWLQHLGSV